MLLRARLPWLVPFRSFGGGLLMLHRLGERLARGGGAVSHRGLPTLLILLLGLGSFIRYLLGLLRSLQLAALKPLRVALLVAGLGQGVGRLGGLIRQFL